MSPTTTRAPFCAKSRASAAPCPRAPPLIKATLPSSLPMGPSSLPHTVSHAPYPCRCSARVAPLPTQSTLHTSGPIQREPARRAVDILPLLPGPPEPPGPGRAFLNQTACAWHTALPPSEMGEGTHRNPGGTIGAEQQ